MKILCISDNVDPVVYSNKISTRFKDIDFVLSSGDLNLDYYGFIVSSLNKPLLFVFGNHNLKRLSLYRKDDKCCINDYSQEDLDQHNFGAIYIGRKVKKINGMIIAGLGGSMKYNDGPNQYSEFEMFFLMLKIIPKLLFYKIFRGRYIDILLTHAPPRGIHDENNRCHRGFKIFLWFMKTFKPKYLIHGHVHIYDKNIQRVTKYEKTTVINACNYFILDTDKE